jgi:hypothetical protein
MLELLSVFQTMEYFSQKENFGMDNLPNPIPTSWIIITFIIAFGTAYIAYSCNEYEVPATRFLITIVSFFFSGFYLIYYFIYHVLMGRECSNGRRINNIIRNIVKKK